MARQIVTQLAVTSAADSLMAEGAEPSIVSVQARIGAGSYSTVKRFLDLWKQERAATAAAAPDTPPEVQTKGAEFTRAVWTLASREAQREAKQAKDESRAEVAAVRAELVEARSEITRLEQVETAQAVVIEELQAKLREVELSLVQTQTQARRIPELERSLITMRAELDETRREATDKAVEAGRLGGEAEALRAQVRDFVAAAKLQK